MARESLWRHRLNDDHPLDCAAGLRVVFTQLPRTEHARVEIRAPIRSAHDIGRAPLTVAEPRG
jgi:hypothetical protein